MKNKKFAAVPLLIAIALSLFGFVYAHWSDYVKIEGTAHMGSLTLAFDPTEFLDCIDIEEVTGDKDIGSCDIYYNLTSYIYDEHTGKYGYKILVFNITNAYPQYEVHFTTVTIHNIGTIPIIISDFIVSDPTGELRWKWEVPPPTSPAKGFFWKDFDGDGVYDLGEEIMNVLIKNFVGEQLEPCEAKKGEVDIDFKQPAEECHTYHFEIEIKGVQWNKYVP